MSERFRDRYRIPSARAKWWDYTRSKLYFITICTHGMECCFGKIVNHEMILSEIGKIATHCWITIPIHFPYIKLHAWIIMPNHIHGIIEIMPNAPVETLHATSLATFPQMRRESLHATASSTFAEPSKETLHATSLQDPSVVSKLNNQKMGSISPRKGSLSSIIRSYKSAVSKQTHKQYPQFNWQERYYDNIIRNTPAYCRIENYINCNVSNWEGDRFHKK